MMRACRDCHLISEGEQCPACKSTNLSKDFLGFAVVLNANKSVIAQKMNITEKGKYALKVR